jgi:hypothetical protein
MLSLMTMKKYGLEMNNTLKIEILKKENISEAVRIAKKIIELRLYSNFNSQTINDINNLRNEPEWLIEAINGIKNLPSV